ncbi:MAG: ABC transporter ATP-binding protein [Deltaproteobacteria bacterium]|nr:ABC transporter ATP-binding protein [Deltaproteobacteria bacterium]
MLPRVGAGLHLSGLRVTVGPPDRRVTAVDGIDLSVAPGEVVAVVGESGCGKSTLLRAVCGLLPRDATLEGTLAWDGTPLPAPGDPGWAALRREVLGVVFQEPGEALNPTRRIANQVIEALPPLPRARRKAAAAALLARAGFPEPEAVLGAYPHALSGGQRQRILAALALARDPALLLADEPTAHLDPTLAAQLLEVLFRGPGPAAPPTPSADRAALWVTHDLAWAARLATRVDVMYAGRVVERGPARAVLEAPRHPYTAGLVAAVPRPGRELAPIPGAPPSLLSPPAGCRFHPRCPRATERCAQVRPEWRAGVACHHPLEAPR